MTCHPKCYLYKKKNQLFHLSIAFVRRQHEMKLDVFIPLHANSSTRHKPELMRDLGRQSTENLLESQG